MQSCGDLQAIVQAIEYDRANRRVVNAVCCLGRKNTFHGGESCLDAEPLKGDANKAPDGFRISQS